MNPTQAAPIRGRTQAPLATTTSVPLAVGQEQVHQGTTGPNASGGALSLCRQTATPVLNGYRDDHKRTAAFQIECPDAAEEMEWESDPYYPLGFRIKAIVVRCDEATRRAAADKGKAAAAQPVQFHPGEGGLTSTGGRDTGVDPALPSANFCAATDCSAYIASADLEWRYGESWHEGCLERTEIRMEKELRR